MQEQFDYIFQRLCHVHSKGFSREFSKTFFESLVPCDFEILNLAIWEFRTEFDRFPNPAQVNEKIRSMLEKKQASEPGKKTEVPVQPEPEFFKKMQCSLSELRENFMQFSESDPDQAQGLMQELERKIDDDCRKFGNQLSAPAGYLMGFLNGSKFKQAQKDMIFLPVADWLFSDKKQVFDLINFVPEKQKTPEP